MLPETKCYFVCSSALINRDLNFVAISSPYCSYIEWAVALLFFESRLSSVFVPNSSQNFDTCGNAICVSFPTAFRPIVNVSLRSQQPYQHPYQHPYQQPYQQV